MPRRHRRAYWGPYAVSKAGLEALVKIYAAEMANTPRARQPGQPGPIRTAMRAKAFPGEDPATLRWPDEITERFVELAEAAMHRQRPLFDLKTNEVR